MNRFLKQIVGPRIRQPAVFQPASDAQKTLFLKHRKEGLPVGEARKKAGLDWAQFKHALADDPEFLEAVEEMESYFLDKLEDVVETMAHNKDGQMARWILERRRSEKYGQKSKVEVSHRFQSAEDIKKLSDEDIIVECEKLGIEIQL